MRPCKHASVQVLFFVLTILWIVGLSGLHHNLAPVEMRHGLKTAGAFGILTTVAFLSLGTWLFCAPPSSQARLNGLYIAVLTLGFSTTFFVLTDAVLLLAASRLANDAYMEIDARSRRNLRTGQGAVFSMFAFLLVLCTAMAVLAVFLPRMGSILNIIVGEGGWWFDRDALREKLPVN